MGQVKFQKGSLRKLLKSIVYLNITSDFLRAVFQNFYVSILEYFAQIKIKNYPWCKTWRPVWGWTSVFIENKLLFVQFLAVFKR